MRSDLITVSRMRTFNSCLRLHFYKYELGYRSTRVAEALGFGTLLHAALEAWWRWWKLQQAKADTIHTSALSAAMDAMTTKAAEGDDVDQVTMAKATVLMCGYDTRWADEMADLEVIAVEVEFVAPLRNPETGRACRDLEVGGKLDVLVRRRSTGKVWIVEHKTSGDDLSLGSSYWLRLRMDPQVSVYFDGARVLGYEVEGCIYDVLSKFRERPQKATPVEKRKYTKKDNRLYAGQRENDETIEEFRGRIAESMAENPEAFYGRAYVCRTVDELEESARDTHATALMMRDCFRLERAPRNPDACFLYHRICDFHAVCSGCASLDDGTQFVRLANVHPELSNDQQ